jgi:hypothetical protein
LIGATKTEKGLSIICVLDEATYDRGLGLGLFFYFLTMLFSVQNVGS